MYYILYKPKKKGNLLGNNHISSKFPGSGNEPTKDSLESIIVAEREMFIKEHRGTKDGFHKRNLDTTFGKLENLKIPRDRKGKFRTKLIELYKRRDMVTSVSLCKLYEWIILSKNIELTQEILIIHQNSKSLTGTGTS